MTALDLDHIAFVHDDGGRVLAGFKGEVGDCVVRAITIATQLDYDRVYRDLRKLSRIAGYPSPRNGVSKEVYKLYLKHAGAEWTPTMHIGSGTRVHLRRDELPAGRLIVRLSGHLAAVIDGVLHDTHDCSREGTRAVYGYWLLPR